MKYLVYNTYSTHRPVLIFFFINEKREEVEYATYCYGIKSGKLSFDDFLKDTAGKFSLSGSDTESIPFIYDKQFEELRNIIFTGNITEKKIPNFYLSNSLENALYWVKKNDRNLTRRTKKIVSWLTNIVDYIEKKIEKDSKKKK